MIKYEIVQEGNKVKVLAVCGGDIVGFGEILKTLECADIIDVEVDLKFRGRGIGRGICERIISDAKDCGIEIITLEVRRSNEIAQRLYQSLGFCKISERAKYYGDGEDAIIMQLKC